MIICGIASYWHKKYRTIRWNRKNTKYIVFLEPFIMALFSVHKLPLSISETEGFIMLPDKLIISSESSLLVIITALSAFNMLTIGSMLTSFSDANSKKKTNLSS